MPIVIDGYNLAWAMGDTGRRLQRGDLAGARDLLIQVLADRLGDRRLQTTVVFDAREPPEHLPRQTTSRGIRILFAVDQPSADELIIELIEADADPRHLLVVSSDRQIRDAARRHRATAIGVGTFLGKLGLTTRSGKRGPARVAPSDAQHEDKPAPRVAPDYWWRQFAHVADVPGLQDITGPGEIRSPQPTRPKKRKTGKK